MKQKNVLLMVVAVACGLAAAVLTTQMTGKPAVPEQVEIWAAAKELPVSTKLTKEKVADLVKKKKVNKTEVPPNAIENEEQLIGKYIQRPLRAEDPIYLTDIADKAPGLSPPAGKHLSTLKLPYESVGPFIEPGSKVDMFVTVQTQIMPRPRQFQLLSDVLVMAVDTGYVAGPQGQNGASGRPQINTVTVAVAPTESKWLDIAAQLQGRIKLLVRGEKSPEVRQLTDEELTRLFFEPEATTPQNDGGKGKKLKLMVPRTFLAAGTEITEDVIRDKFKEKDFDEGDAPKDAVTSLGDYLGKFLTKDAERGEPVAKDGIGEKPEEKPAPKETTPTPMTTEPKPDPKPEPAPKPKKTERKPIKVWEPEISSPKGVEKHLYELYDEKEGWVYRGIKNPDGTITPAPAPEKAPEAPKPDDKGNKVS